MFIAISKQAVDYVCSMDALYVEDKHHSTARGFEPLRAEPNGFLVHHLGHSVTLSCCTEVNKDVL